jgi:mRNA interferase MazF
MYIPEQGDLVILSFSPQAGQEQKGRRPGLVISKKAFNQITRLAFICPITTAKRDYAFHLELPDDLKCHGSVMIDQARSLDYIARDIEFCDRVSENFLNEVLARFDPIFF